MRTKTEQRRDRTPAHRGDSKREAAAFPFDDEIEAPCSEYLVMNQARELPALSEYLHELRESGFWTVH